MKRPLPAICLALASTLALACGGDGTDPGEAPAGFDDHAQADIIVADFAEKIVVPTYAELAARLADLDAAAAELAADATEAKLEAAQQAWIAAREPWEASEGFLFGPVASLGIDPALDSWPVDRTALDAVLASDDELTVEYVGSLETTLYGFHTAEYLLFGEGGARTAAELGERELAYLTAVTGLLAEAGDQLEASWTQDDGETPSYAVVFRSAGRDGNTTYPSLSSAGEEIVRGMIGIADEVANGKIADPFDQMDTTLVESQFSFNSLTDFQNNVRSIQNAYTGEVGFAGTSGLGVSTYVASVDPDLDARVRAEIQAAIDALGAVPPPFRDAVLDPDAADEITAAQEAIRTVQTTLELDVLPLFL